MKKILLRIAISGGFLALLGWLMKEDLPEVLSTLRNVNRPLFAVAALISLSTIFVLAKRLQLIFEAEEVRMPFLEASNLTFVGYFFNNFLPTSVGGDIVKAMCASRVTRQPVKSVTSVLMDRIFGLFTFILIPSISLLFLLREMNHSPVPVVIYTLLALSIATFFLLFNKDFARRFHFIGALVDRLHWGDKIKKIYNGLHDFQRHRITAVQAMLLSFVGQAVSIFSLYCSAVALGAHVSILYLYLLVPVVHLISMLPSLNGLGIREGAYVYFLTPYTGREYAAAIGIVWLVFLMLFSLIGGIIYFFRHDYHIRFKEAAVS